MVTVVPLTVMLLDEMVPAVPLERVYLTLLTVVMALLPLPQFTVTVADCPASVTFWTLVTDGSTLSPGFSGPLALSTNSTGTSNVSLELFENTRIKSEPANGVVATLIETVLPSTVMLEVEIVPAVPLARVYFTLLTVVMALSPYPQSTVKTAD